MPTGIYDRTQAKFNNGMFKKGPIRSKEEKLFAIKQYREKKKKHRSESGYDKKWRHKKGISKKYNSESGVSYTKEYRKLNHQIQHQKRRILMKEGGRLSIQTIQLVYEDNIKKYGTLTCYLCLEPISFGKDHLEHKQPLSRGGMNEYNNLAVACQKCNCSKGKKTEKEYRGKDYKTELLIVERVTERLTYMRLGFIKLAFRALLDRADKEEK